MIKRLRLRFTFVCALSTALVLITMAAASCHVAVGHLRRQGEVNFTGELNSVFFYLRGNNAISHTWLAQTEHSGGMWIRIQREETELMFNTLDGRRIALTDEAREAAVRDHGVDLGVRPSSSLQPNINRFLLESGGTRYRAAVCAVPVGEQWLSVTVLKDMTGEENQILRLRITFVWFVLLAVICLTVFSWLFTAQAVRPVEESRRRQAEFVSAASHELRSPLSVMQLSAERITRLQGGEVGVLAGKIEGECRRMSRLTSDLLRLASADQGAWSMEFGEVEPETLLLSTLERFEQLAGEKNVSLTVRLPEEPMPPLRCDTQRIEQILAVLTDNAMRYAPQGGWVHMGVERRGRQVCFWVEDNGPGVPVELREQIFLRFFRGDKARSGKEHFGIGLAVAREIALLHKGSLWAEDGPQGGARFVLRLPMRRA